MDGPTSTGCILTLCGGIRVPTLRCLWRPPIQISYGSQGTEREEKRMTHGNHDRNMRERP